MDNNQAMKMSMLLDDELKEKEALSLLEQIENDTHLKNKWFRYNTVSLVIKSDVSLALQPTLVEQVSRAISHDPTVLAPQPEAKKRPKFQHVFAGGALAAAVAVMTVVHFNPLPDAETGGDLMAIADQEAIRASSKRALESRYHDYLINHNESAYFVGARGVLPYARLVNHGPNR